MKNLERVWIVPLIVAHVAKFGYWFRNLEFSSPYPIINYDFIQYYARILRSHEFLSESGRIWGYDPFQMAGYISGPFLAVGSYLLMILTYVFSPLLSVQKSLLIFQCLGYLLSPFAIVFFIRLFGGSRNQSWVGFGITLLLFGHMEQFTFQLIHVGLWGYQMAVFGSFLQVAFVWKWATRRKYSDGIIMILVTSLLFQLHPAALLIICVPNLLTYLYLWREFKLGHHLFILAGLTVVVALNYYWIKPFLMFSHFMDSAPYFLSGGFKQLYDLLGPIQGTWFYFVRTIFYWLILIFSFQHVRNLFRKNKPMAWILLSWMGWLFLVGYFGSDLPLIKNLQPSRIIMALWILMGALSSFMLLDKVWKRKKQRELILGLVALILLVAFNRPQLGWSYLYNQLLPHQVKLVDYLKDKGPSDSRILVSCSDTDAAHISDLLPALTGRAIIGGPHPGNFIKGRSTLLAENYWDGHKINFRDPKAFDHLLKAMTKETFASYLDLYNISLILTNGPKTIDHLHQWDELLTSEGRVGGYNIFRVNQPSSWFVEGSGEVVFGYDAIQIEQASSGRLILKSHWVKTFKTEPSVEIEPVYLVDDPVPFIQINNTGSHRRIKIFNKSP